MTTSNYRREFWQTIYEGAFNVCADPTQSAKAADNAIREFDARFPEKEALIKGPILDLMSINEEAKLITELLKAIGELKNIASPKPEFQKGGLDGQFLTQSENNYLKSLVDQYSAQLADYRKAGPQKDIEIERLTREGLIKDQKLIHKDNCIAELEAKNAQLNDVANDLHVQHEQAFNELKHDVKFRDTRIAQLEDMVKLAERLDVEKSAKIEAHEWNIKSLESIIRVKNNQIAALQKDHETLVVEYNKRVFEIAELGKELTSLREIADRNAQTSVNKSDLLRERDKRIAELEKKIEDLLAPAVVSEQPKRRTAVEWLEDLPEPYRSQALANAKNRDCGRWESEIREVNTLWDALGWSFEWSKSPEGLVYWEEIFAKLMNGEPLVAEMIVDKGLGKAEQAPPMPHQYAEPEAVNKPEPIEEKPTTVKGWLELLEEPYRGQALENAKAALGHFAKNMSTAIYAFAWYTTPEGWDYWHDLDLIYQKQARQIDY